MKRFISYTDFVNENKEAYSAKNKEALGIERGKWVEVNPDEHPELADEFFDMINLAYKSLGGHVKIKKPTDVFKDKSWTYWSGVDLHGAPDFDLIIFGRETKYGIKSTGVGHDGTRESTREYLNKKALDLSTMGHYAEVSGKLSQILINKYKVHQVTDEAIVAEILGKNREIVWHGKHPEGTLDGEGWYSRKIGGKLLPKLMVGNPTI